MIMNWSEPFYEDGIELAEWIQNTNKDYETELLNSLNEQPDFHQETNELTFEKFNNRKEKAKEKMVKHIKHKKETQRDLMQNFW